MKLSEVEEKLNAARAGQTTLKSQLAERAETLATKRDEYETAVRSGAAEAELDKMDAEIFKLDRERTRVEIRLNQCGAEIEQLFQEREQAHAEEERGKYAVDVTAALAEAKEIEATVQLLIGSVATHSARLDRMRRYCEVAGAAQIPFRLVNLERRVSTIFSGNNSLHKIYEKPYPEILQSNIAAVERQLNRSAPATEMITGEQEAEQQSAVNN